jgi:hypothetical protein
VDARSEKGGDSEWFCAERSALNRKVYVGREVLEAAVRKAVARNSCNSRHLSPQDKQSTATDRVRNLGLSLDISEIELAHKLPGIEGIYDVREETLMRRAVIDA